MIETYDHCSLVVAYSVWSNAINIMRSLYIILPSLQDLTNAYWDVCMHGWFGIYSFSFISYNDPYCAFPFTRKMDMLPWVAYKFYMRIYKMKFYRLEIEKY